MRKKPHTFGDVISVLILTVDYRGSRGESFSQTHDVNVCEQKETTIMLTNAFEVVVVLPDGVDPSRRFGLAQTPAFDLSTLGGEACACAH